MARDSTYQDLQEMKYLEVFIKESQRLIPAVSFIGREAQENIQLGRFYENDSLENIRKTF